MFFILSFCQPCPQAHLSFYYVYVGEKNKKIALTLHSQNVGNLCLSKNISVFCFVLVSPLRKWQVWVLVARMYEVGGGWELPVLQEAVKVIYM